MLVTTTRPTVFGLAKRAWSSLFRAAVPMALLFIIGFALMAGLDIAIQRLTPSLAIPTRDALKEIITNNRRLPWLDVAKAVGLDVVVCILRALITAPLAVAMHRFILLDETRRFYFVSRTTLRFSVWLVLLQVPTAILWWLILFASGATGLVPLLIVLLIALLLFLMQTLQLLPAVATEERSPDTSARLETALERAEGMFWLTLAALFLTFLPVIIVQAIAMRAFTKLATHAPLIVPLARAAAGFIIVVLSASLVSWLYSYGAYKKAAGAQLEMA
jgi:hypothetical protein